MLESILERPSLEGTQSESNLNGTARLSVSSCQSGFSRLNRDGEGDVGPSSEATYFDHASLQQSSFSEVREGRPPQIEGTATALRLFFPESRVLVISVKSWSIWWMFS